MMRLMRERGGHGASGGRRPFLAMLTPEDAAALQSRLTERVAAPGRILLRAGAPGSSVLLVLSGRVKIVSPGAATDQIMLGFAGPGELVGELAALDGWPRTSDVVALDHVRAGSLDASELRSFLAERPSAMFALTRMIAARMRDCDRDRVQLLTADGFGRTAALLCELADRFGEPSAAGIRIGLQASQDELARWIGSSRITVARALSLMRRLGWVTTKRRGITVTNLEALRARSLEGSLGVAGESPIAA